jgi:hypothetical protein
MGFENFQRSSIFELLRIIAMFAIIAHHLVNHGLTVTLLSKKLFLNTTFEQALFFGGGNLRTPSDGFAEQNGRDAERAD